MAEIRPIMDAVRVANRDLNIREYEARKTRLNSMPLALFIELTQNCNLSCPMCRSAGGYDSEWNMAQQSLDELYGEVLQKAMIADLRGFGESTLLKEFPRRVKELLDTGVQLRLVTNGQVNRVDAWDIMMAHSSLIAVSCDAASDELFGVLRRGGSITRLSKTVAEITKRRDQHGAQDDLVCLTVAVSRPNLAELTGIVQLAESLNVHKVVLFPIQIDLDHEWHLRGDLDGTARALDAARAEADRLGVVLQLGAALDPSHVLPDKVKESCMHPWSFAYVNFAGRVGFCDHLIGDPQYTFGSLAELPFKEIWNGPRFDSLRAAHARKQIPNEFNPCKWCFKQRYVDFEHLLHESYATRVVSSKSGDLLQLIGDPEMLPASVFG